MMKTTYRRNSSGLWSGRLTAIALVIAIGLGLYFLGRPLVNLISAPVLNAKSAAGHDFGNFFSRFRSEDSLASDIATLRQKAEAYDSLMQSYAALASSSDEVLKHYGRSSSSTEIAASVIMHPPETPYDVLVIDAGESEGIHTGALVSLPEGGALGTVVETFAHTARVSLFTSSGRETKGYISGNGEAVILKGAGGGTFKLDLPRDLPLEVGDFVFTQDLSPELLGVVSRVDLAPTDAEKKAVLSGVANVNNVRYVVVKPKS